MSSSCSRCEDKRKRIHDVLLINIEVPLYYTIFLFFVYFNNHQLHVFHKGVQFIIWVPVDYSTENVALANSAYFNPQ